MDLKYKITKLLDKAVSKYLRYRAKDSNYISYAKKEFRIAWGDYEKDEMQNFMTEQVLDILALLSTHGDSGFSINYKLGLLTKLIQFKPLTKLMFTDDEFYPACEFLDGVRQNKRNSAVFTRPDGTFSYSDGFSKKSSYKYYDGVWSEGSGLTWSGSVFVVRDDGTFYTIGGTSIIKDLENFKGTKYTIPMYEIECPKDWWLSFVKESDMKEFLTEYNVLEIESNFNQEVYDFKGGIYTKEILGAIESMCELMGIKYEPSYFEKGDA